MSIDFRDAKTNYGKPKCELLDSGKVIGSVYLSPDGETLRIVLNELRQAEQLKIDVEHRLVDFKRRL